MYFRFLSQMLVDNKLLSSFGLWAYIWISYVNHIIQIRPSNGYLWSPLREQSNYAFHLCSLCCILTFDPAKNAIPRWCTERKWHIPVAFMRGNIVGGNWLTKWDKLKFLWYTHRLMHRKRVTCELHDSYFRLMTIKHAIPKIQ